MRVFCVALAFIAFAFCARAEIALDWSDLVDVKAQDFQDPFRSLDFDQIDDVRTVLIERGRLLDETLRPEDRVTARERIDEAIARLSADELDADWLISQRWVVAERRKRAATAGNPDLDGSEATLSGFVIPAPPDEEGRFTAYLVPERGMCSHMPPPPPNQLLRLVFEEAWYPQFIYEPIKVSGRLEIQPSERVMRVADGPVNMSSTFTIDVASVEKMIPQSQNSNDGRRPWPLRPPSELHKTGVE